MESLIACDNNGKGDASRGSFHWKVSVTDATGEVYLLLPGSVRIRNAFSCLPAPRASAGGSIWVQRLPLFDQVIAIFEKQLEIKRRGPLSHKGSSGDLNRRRAQADSSPIRLRMAKGTFRVTKSFSIERDGEIIPVQRIVPNDALSHLLQQITRPSPNPEKIQSGFEFELTEDS